jgi:hypothetical protein
MGHLAAFDAFMGLDSNWYHYGDFTLLPHYGIYNQTGREGVKTLQQPAGCRCWRRDEPSVASVKVGQDSATARSLTMAHMKRWRIKAKASVTFRDDCHVDMCRHGGYSGDTETQTRGYGHD